MIVGFADTMTINNSATTTVVVGSQDLMASISGGVEQTVAIGAAAGGTLLLTAKVSPARWKSRLKDLDSRLKAAASVEIGHPDDDLLKAVLAKQFSDRQLLVDQEVISYAAKRMERSLAEVRTIVDGADKLSLVKGHKVTMPLIRDVLAISSAG